MTAGVVCDRPRGHGGKRVDGGASAAGLNRHGGIGTEAGSVSSVSPVAKWHTWPGSAGWKDGMVARWAAALSVPARLDGLLPHGSVAQSSLVPTFSFFLFFFRLPVTPIPHPSAAHSVMPVAHEEDYVQV